MQMLAKKLVLFRSDMAVVVKDTSNPFFKSKYADLPSILAEIKPVMTTHRLALFHVAKFDESGRSYLESTLVDSESGESAVSVFPIFGTKPQEIGSSMTYARRYNLQALLDLSTDDDDGNLANSAKPTKKADAKTESENQKLFEMILDGIVDAESVTALGEVYKHAKTVALGIGQERFDTVTAKVKEKKADLESAAREANETFENQ